LSALRRPPRDPSKWQVESKENKVAVKDIVPAAGGSFEDTLAASPDLLREMIKGFAQRTMDAEVEGICGAGYGEVSADLPGRGVR
jgi:hypothetical protein